MSVNRQLPNGWQEKRLKDVGKCLTGLTYTPNDVTDNSGLLVLRSSNVKGGKIVFEDNVFVRKDINVNNCAQCGDILVCVRNGSSNLIGKNAIVSADVEGLAHGAFMMLFRSKHNQYLYQLFCSRMYDKQVYRNLGATINSINSSDFYKFKFPFPPLPEQKAIADLLSTWDEAIEKIERLLQAKGKQFKRMSRWLLFGHKRLGNQENELADGYFFKYPPDWGLVKISKVAKEVSLRNGESEETVLSCSKYDGFVNSLDYFGKKVFSSDTSNYKVVKKGQFGYPSNHIEEGSIGLLEHCEKGIVSPIYVIFEAAKDKVHPPYLYRLLKTDIYRHIFQVSTSSSVDRRGSLRWGDFSKIRVPLPTFKEQELIAETLSSAQQEIDLLKKLAEKLKTQKRGLMQKLLTGEWRVKPEIVNQYKEA